jgi:hypothetical protein
MQVYTKFKQLSRADQFMMNKLFTKQEIQSANWFITHIHKRDELIALVQTMGSDATFVRSIADDQHTSLYAAI